MRLITVSLVAVLALGGCALLPAGESVTEEQDSQSVELEAPESFGDWTTSLSWAEDKDEELGGTRARDNEALQRAERDVDEETLRESYGAAAIVENYQRDNFNQQMLLRMVATQADGYFVQASASDAERVNAVEPPQEVRTIGDAECYVQHPMSQEEESEDNAFSECVMRSENLTIWLGPVAMVPDDLAELTQEVWDEVGGGDPITSSSSSHDTIDLPETIDGYVRAESVMNDPQRYEEYADDDLTALAAVYDADAGVAYYAAPDLDSFFDLYIVDAVVVEPFVHYLDPERLGVVAPSLQRVEIDGAICLVYNTMIVREGGSADDLEPQIQWCYLTDGERTAFALNVGGEVGEDTSLIPAILHSVLD